MKFHTVMAVLYCLVAIVWLVEDPTSPWAVGTLIMSRLHFMEARQAELVEAWTAALEKLKEIAR